MFRKGGRVIRPVRWQGAGSRPALYASGSSTPRGRDMSDDEFWSLIDRLDWTYRGKDELVVEPLVAKLATQSDATITDFDDALAAKLHALDGERYAREIGEHAYTDNGSKYFSVDLFLYARCAVVTAGREIYQAVLADPTEMPKDTEFEAVLYVAQQAYERKSGGKYTHVPTPSYETYSNETGW
jgi:hypothetical protein